MLKTWEKICNDKIGTLKVELQKIVACYEGKIKSMEDYIKTIATKRQKLQTLNENFIKSNKINQNFLKKK
mgnify:CR=1 FL=1